MSRGRGPRCGGHRSDWTVRVAKQVQGLQPAGVGDGEGPARYVAAEGLHAFNEAGQGLTAARRMVQQVGTPGIDLGLADHGPGLAVPMAEVEFQQAFVDDVGPTPARKPGTHCVAARERRGEDLARQAVTAGGGAHAVREALAAPRVDAQVGAADAAPRSAVGARVAP